MGWKIDAATRTKYFADGLAQRAMDPKKFAAEVPASAYFIDGAGWCRKFCVKRTSPATVVARSLRFVHTGARVMVCWERPGLMFEARDAVRAKRSATPRTAAALRDRLAAYVRSCREPAMAAIVVGAGLDDLVTDAEAFLDTLPGNPKDFTIQQIEGCAEHLQRLHDKIDPKIAATIDENPPIMPLPLDWQDAFDRPIVKPALVGALVRGVKRWARDTLSGAETDQIVMAMPSGDVWRWPALPSPPVLPGLEGAGDKRKRPIVPSEMDKATVAEIERESWTSGWQAAVSHIVVASKKRVGYGEGEMACFQALKAAARGAGARGRKARRVWVDPRAEEHPGAPPGSFEAVYASGDTDCFIQAIPVLADVRLHVVYATVKLDAKTGIVYRSTARPKGGSRAAPASAKPMCEAVNLSACYGQLCIDHPFHVVLGCVLTAATDYSKGLGGYGLYKAPMLARARDAAAPIMARRGPAKKTSFIVNVDKLRRYLAGVKRDRRSETKIDEFLAELRHCIFTAAYFCYVYADRPRAGPTMADVPSIKSGGAKTITQWLSKRGGKGEEVLVGPEA